MIRDISIVELENIVDYNLKQFSDGRYLAGAHRITNKRSRYRETKKSNILIVGMGGVGSFAAEFIARSGVGNLTIVDGDIIDITNINRQLPLFTQR